jgi:hypothetical protein
MSTKPKTTNTWKQPRPLSELYVIRDPSSVWTFLEAMPSLVELLGEAQEHIRAYFQRNELILQLVVDPEEPREQHLSVLIVIDKRHINTERERLKTFRQHWWSPSLSKAEGKLTISLSF